MIRLYICCCQCSDSAWAPFDGDRLDPGTLFREIGWVVSVVGSPGNMAMATPEVKLAPVCGGCAKELYPEALRAAATAAMSRRGTAS